MRDRSLALIAPHGTFFVRGLDPAVAREVATFPEETAVECDGDYEGGANIEFLVVTRITNVITPLVPLAGDRPDREVHADGALARARAAERLGRGDVDGAAEDLGHALRLGAQGADDVYAALPPAHREALVDAYARWANAVSTDADVLRWLPVTRWTDDHLGSALTAALARGGRFGEITAEVLIAELTRRGSNTEKVAKKLAKLRRAQATEGDTFVRITTRLEASEVVGATRDTIYVAGKLEVGPPAVTPPDGRRHFVRRCVPALIAYDTEGRERARYLDVAPDEVVDGVALQRYERRSPDRPLPHLWRLADNAVLHTFTSEVLACDHELVATRVEIRRFATGELVATLPDGATDVWWDAEHIHVHGVQPCVLSRATGTLLPESPRARLAKITTPDGTRHTIDRSNQVADWICISPGRKLFVGPAGGELVELQLRRNYDVTLVPPWLALAHPQEPLLLIAIAEVVTCTELRVDGTLVASRVAH